MKKNLSRALIALSVAAIGAGVYYWWQQGNAAPVAVISAPTSTALAPTASLPDAATPAPAPSPAEPAIRYPLATEAAIPAPDRQLPSLAEADPYVSQALNDLLSPQDILRYVVTEGFVRHVVATVDNLGRAQAPKSVWPVHPTPGRFTTQPNPAGAVISLDNSLRYSPFVRFAESIDTTKAVALYIRLYPLFQRAYEELGFPKSYFNDRLVAVIDQLLATPQPNTAISVSLLEVKGPIPSLQPWVRYEFTDPTLKALSSGQKILLRMGPENHQRIKTKLLELRTAIVAASVTKPATAAPS